MMYLTQSKKSMKQNANTGGTQALKYIVISSSNITMIRHIIRRASHTHSRTIFPRNNSIHDKVIDDLLHENKNKVIEELLREQNKLLREIKVGTESIGLSIIGFGLFLAFKPF
jgi:hypothetical protein